MEELKKITVDVATPIMQTEAKKKKKFPWKAIGIPVGVLVVLLVIIGVMLLPLRGVVAKAKGMTTVGQEAMQAVKDKDLALVKTKLNETRTKLTELQVEYKKVLPLKIVPFLGLYIADGEHGINAGFAALTAGDKAIEAIEPNADLLGLKGGSKSSFLEGTAEERLQFAVKTMSALLPKINEIAASVETMQTELEAIDPNRYPEKIGKTVIRSKMAGGFAVINEMANLFVNAQPLLMNLPSLLGDPSDKRYLVIFQNDKELRSTGGFITAYAQFRMVKGKPILEKADDIYALDAALTKKFAAPREILTFHKGVYNLNIRDSNLSPDFKVSMQQFMEMYNQTSGKEKIDGVLAVDTHVLVEMLKVLGPINVYGREFSAVIDKRCDCPKAVYELEDYSTRPVGYVRDARKDIIGVLLQQILQMALGVSPSKYWGNLFQVLIDEINQKHVLAYFMDTTTQKAAEDFNMAGRVMTASESAAILKYEEGKGWDYLYLVNSNMAGAKSNMFVSSKVTKDTTVSGKTLTTKLTIDYKNPYPGSDCGLESGGLCLNAPLRNWVRVYVPAGSTLAESKGSISPKDSAAASMETYQSLGKTMFEGFLIVNPMGTAKLELTYTSPVEVAGQYKLLIQKQGGTDGEEYILKLNGKQRKDLPLVGDTEFTF
ncbi:MAG: DUF4012 domain-containing protein [Microgenomates group bacterium]